MGLLPHAFINTRSPFFLPPPTDRARSLSPPFLLSRNPARERRTRTRPCLYTRICIRVIIATPHARVRIPARTPSRGFVGRAHRPRYYIYTEAKGLVLPLFPSTGGRIILPSTNSHIHTHMYIPRPLRFVLYGGHLSVRAPP